MLTSHGPMFYPQSVTVQKSEIYSLKRRPPPLPKTENEKLMEMPFPKEGISRDWGPENSFDFPFLTHLTSKSLPWKNDTCDN